MKVTSIKVNSNGGIGGGCKFLRTKMTLDQVMEDIINSPTMMRIYDELSEKYWLVNPNWISYVTEVYVAEKHHDHGDGTSTKYYYVGVSEEEALYKTRDSCCRPDDKATVIRRK